MNKYHPSAIEVGQIYFDHHSETNGTFECGELIVQAADRAIQNAKSDWQLIETAPRDGTSILGVIFREYMGGGSFPEGAVMMWKGGRIIKGGWAYMGHVVSFVDDAYLPTHWMPLPEAPHD